jgi:RNA polymerase primary sigma factor
MAATAVHARYHDPAPSTAPRRPDRIRLSRAEEVELAARAARGDRGARDRLVEANLGLVHAIARDFRGRGLELDDLVGEGRLGLFRAAEKFDPRHRARFGTYAAYWIKEAIGAALRDQAPVIRLPAWMVKRLSRWRRAERALRREMGREPDFEEVAAALGLGAAQRPMVARALQARQVRSQCGPGEEAGDRPLAEVGDRLGRAEERAEAEDERAGVRRRMGRLDDRERTVLALRYGLEGEALTLREIGGRLGMTREWARKLELRALARLREA